MKDSLHLRLALAQGQINKNIQEKAKEIDLLPGQSKILESVAANPGCTQNALCRDWDLDKSTVSGLLKRMEKSALVAIYPSETDRRKKGIYLTDLGKEKWAVMEHFLEAQDAHYLALFSSENASLLLEELKAIHDTPGTNN